MKMQLMCLLITGGWLAGQAAERPPARSVTDFTNFPPRVIEFIGQKEQQTTNLAHRLQVELPPTSLEFFASARQGNWVGAFALFDELKGLFVTEGLSAKERTVFATAKQTALEIQLALEQFVDGEPAYAKAFGEQVVRSLPRGSIYFGGTDYGRGLVTAFSVSHEKGDPGFTITQRALADGGYLEYLRTMYGAKIRIPSDEDSKRAFQDYMADAQRRFEHDRDLPNEPRQLEPGEEVNMVAGRVQVSGHVAVMAINARLVKTIVEQNPDREFFVEESFPLNWMYPHLAPHGLIMKLHRKPLESIPASVLEEDRKFWSNQVRPMIGDWLKFEGSVQEVCRFVEKVYGRQDLTSFKGDVKFVQNESAGKMYSKLRSAIGGVYAKRASGTKNAGEKRRLLQEADFAYRQAFALSPGPEQTFRYLALLSDQGALDDGLLLAESAKKVRPEPQFDNVIAELQRMKEQRKDNTQK